MKILEALENGLNNLFKNIENIKEKFGLNVIVAINKYSSDTEKEINFLREKLQEKNIDLSLVEGQKPTNTKKVGVGFYV